MNVKSTLLLSLAALGFAGCSAPNQGRIVDASQMYARNQQTQGDLYATGNQGNVSDYQRRRFPSEQEAMDCAARCTPETRYNVQICPVRCGDALGNGFRGVSFDEQGRSIPNMRDAYGRSGIIAFPGNAYGNARFTQQYFSSQGGSPFIRFQSPMFGGTLKGAHPNHVCTGAQCPNGSGSGMNYNYCDSGWSDQRCEDRTLDMKAVYWAAAADEAVARWKAGDTQGYQEIDWQIQRERQNWKNPKLNVNFRGMTEGLKNLGQNLKFGLAQSGANLVNGLGNSVNNLTAGLGNIQVAPLAGSNVYPTGMGQYYITPFAPNVMNYNPMVQVGRAYHHQAMYGDQCNPQYSSHPGYQFACGQVDPRTFGR